MGLILWGIVLVLLVVPFVLIVRVLRVVLIFLIVREIRVVRDFLIFYFFQKFRFRW